MTLSRIFLVLVAVLSGWGAVASADPITLSSGHYESAALVCAYNVEPAPGQYIAEGVHSDRLRCRDSGVVLFFDEIEENVYRKEFPDAGIAYQWKILTRTSFLEEILKVRADGTWYRINQYLYRLQ